jgi:DNA-binding transcriptional ArsR family regulator
MMGKGKGRGFGGGAGRGAGRMSGPMMDPRSKLLFAMGNDQRIKILEALKSGEKSSAELVSILMLDPSVVSRHLSQMRSVGIVDARKEGVTMFFSIGDKRVLQILDLATDIARDWLSSFNEFLK